MATGFDDDGLIVGYGMVFNCFSSDCSGTGTGVRRWGIAKDVGVSDGMLMHRTDVSNEETIHHGDSGGPIFLRKHPGDAYVLAGVASYMRTLGIDQTSAHWAITGDIEGLASGVAPFFENTDWLWAELGGDSDSDGIPDELDNCLRECDRWSTTSCWNPSQADFDGDGIGDVCDLCPEHASGGLYIYQSDEDRDEVGDECDWAKGHQIPFLRCTTDVHCAAQFAGFCVLEPGDRDGRCSRQRDRDLDLVEDSVDLCPGDPDPTNRNSNWIAEELRGVSVKGDMCDEVPIFRLEKQTDPTTKTDDPGRMQKEPFQGATMLGVDAPRDLENARVVIRQCSCFTSPRSQRSNAEAEPDDLECARRFCDTDDAEWAQDGWKEITFERVTKEGAKLDLNDHFRYLHFRRGAPGDIMFFNWLWSNDIDKEHNLQGVDSRQFLPAGLYEPFSGTNGLLGSVVTGRETNWLTTRDREQQLRVSTSRFFTPNVFVKERFPYSPPIPWYDACLRNPGCNLWIWKWQYAINPTPILNSTYRTWDRNADPMPAVVYHYGGLVAFDSNGGASSLYTLMELRMHAIDFEQVAWIPPAESPERLERHPFWTQAIGLNRWEEGDPVMVFVEGDGLGLRRYSELGVASGRQPLRLEEGVRPLYSATEERVYLVGWNNEFGPAIRSYDLFAGKWDDLSWTNSLAPQGPPLAAAYDVVSRKLYVLQIDEVFGGRHHVRLIEHDLSRKTSTIRRAWLWSYSGGQYQLAVLPDRRLALIHDTSGRYSVCGLDPSGTTAFRGMATGMGILVGFPAVSRNGVQIFLYDTNDNAFDEDIGFRTVSVHENEWDPRASCPAADGYTW